MSHSIRVLLLWVVVVTIASAAKAQDLRPFSTTQAAKGLVINEIYIGTTASAFLASDQFVELYNPQSTVQYLDGALLVRFGTGGALTKGALQKPAEAWKFPGVPGGKSLRVQPGTFVVIAATAKSFSGGVDLSNADFETYTGNALLDQDAASATNLTKIGATLLTADFTLSTSHDAVVLTDGTDTTLSDGILATTVIDGVQYATSGSATLPAAIDAGIAGGSGLRLGVSLERTSKGLTTLNSTNDFTLTAPTPGYQHGTQGSSIPKVTDLMPLTRGRYVDYDAYTTDTLGAIIPSTKSHASYTIVATGQSFGGSTGVIDSRDTSNAFSGISGTVADVHYLPTAAGDVQAYGDQAFLSTFVPAAFAALVTPPNVFVDYLKTSVGINKSYPVATIQQDVMQQGITVTVNATVTGSYQGIESVTVPKGVFDTAYKFGIKADIKITAFGFPISSLAVTEQIWIVRGIGIVKTNLPSAEGTQFSLPGSERDMTAFGTRAVSAVTLADPTQANTYVYPNPATAEAWIPVTGNARIDLYAVTGDKVRTVKVVQGTALAELNVADLPNGSYLARVTGENGQVSTSRLVVRH